MGRCPRPLGVEAVCSKLESDGLFVPVLPAPDQMTPNDLVLVWMHSHDDDFEVELASWTDGRGEEQATRELRVELRCYAARRGAHGPRLSRAASPDGSPMTFDLQMALEM
jgi:hypothetical protein